MTLAPIFVTQLCAQQVDPALAREIFRQLVEIDTSHTGGSVDLAAEAARQRLLQAGFAALTCTRGGAT